MNKILAVALVLAVAAFAGCRRRPSPDSIGGAPRPIWSSTEVTVVEGKRVSLTLALAQPPGSDVEVSLGAGGSTDIAFPDTVTFHSGDDSQAVSITVLALEPGPFRDPVLTARTANGSSSVTFHIIDDDADLGKAVGPVAFGTGVVVLAGAGADTNFGTLDDEFLAAKNIGTSAPTLTRVAVGSLTGGAECLPVVSPGGSVLLLATGPAPTLVQVGSVPDAPAVTASLVLPAKNGGVSRPVMIGTRAVVASRGTDLVTSADDALLVIEGIGTTTMTAKTVPLPGLGSAEPSIPVQLNATSLLITTAGPDFLFGTGNEVLTLVKGLDTPIPTVVPLYVGRIRGDASGRAMASGGTIAAVCTAGFDAAFSTADDELQVVRDVLVLPTPALPIVIGALAAGAEGLPLATGSDAAIIPTLGADLLPGTTDDEATVVSPLSSDPMTADVLAAGRGLAGTEGALVLVASGAVARLECGADGVLGSSDDALRLFTALGTVSPATSAVATNALQPWGPMVLDASSVALCGAGPDHAAGTADDVTIRVAGIGGAAAFSTNPTGAFAPLGKPVLASSGSGGSVVARTAGPDAAAATADDRLSVAVSP